MVNRIYFFPRDNKGALQIRSKRVPDQRSLEEKLRAYWHSCGFGPVEIDRLWAEHLASEAVHKQHKAKGEKDASVASRYAAAKARAAEQAKRKPPTRPPKVKRKKAR